MAAIDFPNSPTNGQIFSSGGKSWKYNSTKGIWQTVASTTTKNLAALDESIIPSSNVTYDLGSSSNSFRDLYLSGSSITLGDKTITSDNDGVVLPEGSKVGSISIGAGGATVYANTSVLPTTNLTAGSFAFVGNTLFITNGSGWYSVGVTNQSPTLSLSTNSITLGGSGNTINFTFTATDPDGPTPTVTLETTANTSQANVTLFTSNNTVTVENLSTDPYSANIVVTATDGINQTFDTVTLTVAYEPDWALTTQQAKIQSDDVEAGDQFGQSVAIDGDTAIVGAYLEDTGGSDAGAAYIFTRSGSTWTQQAKIMASDAEASDNFGYSVAISGDTAIVGAYKEDTGGSDAGAAYIFTTSDGGSTWTQQAKIQASDKESSDQFGQSVAIDGDTVIVGANAEDTGGSDAGAAYIFTRSGSSWSQQAKIQASDKQESDRFGVSVAIDGDTVIVGAYLEDTGGSSAGAAYIFTRSGSSWSQQAKIQASDKEQSDQFGWSVAIDGDTVIVGAYLEDTGGSSAGAAYIFTTSDGGSTWTQQAKIQSDDVEAGDIFGYSVAISGNTVIIGANGEDTGGSDAGAAYIFTRSGSSWSQQAKIQASDKEQSDQFGRSVAIDGDTAIVGAYLEDTGGSNAGAAYIFTAG